MRPNNTHTFHELLMRDRRYKAEAYAFVFETLDYAINVLHLGQDRESEPVADDLSDHESFQDPEDVPGHRNHISGQDLCHAAKFYALQQYGYLARTVLDSMGIRKTDDLGEIVYNLIGIGEMSKTTEDRREDFDGVFDFETAFNEKYRIDSCEGS